MGRRVERGLLEDGQRERDGPVPSVIVPTAIKNSAIQGSDCRQPISFENAQSSREYRIQSRKMKLIKEMCGEKYFIG